MEMQPRRLVTALIATVVAGTAFGVVTTVADASEPTPMLTAVSDSNDATRTEAVPTFSAPPIPVATAVPMPPSAIPTPGPTQPAAARVSSPRPRPTPTRSQPAAIHTHADTSISPTPRALTPTRPTNGWAPPRLRTGSARLSLPTLNSTAKVSLTIGCVPSASCSVAGNVLTIDPSASSVMLVWSAPRTATHAAWQATTSLG